MNKTVLVSRAGCFLPLLIIFNLLFGWMFFRPLYWLLIEAGLVLVFMFSSAITVRKIFSQAQQPTNTRRKDAIDVESEVIDDHKQLGKE